MRLMHAKHSLLRRANTVATAPVKLLISDLQEFREQGLHYLYSRCTGESRATAEHSKNHTGTNPRQK